MNEIYLEKAKAAITDNWLLINAAAQRAAELARGARPMVPLTPGEAIDFLDIALLEIGEGKITVARKDSATKAE